MIEWLAAEYSIGLSAAVWDIPLAAAMVLLPVRNERHGGSSGPAYTTQASMAARNRARAFLEAHFEIVNRPACEIGWQLG